MGAWAVFLSVRFVTLPCHYLRELALLQTLKLSSQVRCAGPHAGWVAKPGMLSRPQAVLFYICADHGRQACGLSLAPKFPMSLNIAVLTYASSVQIRNSTKRMLVRY